MKAWLKKNKISLLILGAADGNRCGISRFLSKHEDSEHQPSDGRGDRNNARRIEELPCAARLGTQK